MPDYDGPVTAACRAPARVAGPPRLAGGRPAFRSYSFYDLFYSQQQVIEGVAPEIAPETFRDHIVVVGVASEGLRDVFVTPFGEGRMPGAEIHANAVDAWLGGRTLTPVPAGRGALATLGSAFLVGATGPSPALGDGGRGGAGGCRPGVGERDAVRGRGLVAAGGAPAGRGPGVRRRAGLAVFRRRAREAEGEAAVLALRRP